MHQVAGVVVVAQSTTSTAQLAAAQPRLLGAFAP
jgi:hypothetical protein